MRIATGVDIMDLQEVAKTLHDPAQLQRMLHPGDLIRSEPEHVGGRIALKEAVIKAVGLKPGDWLNIHIQTIKSGKPVISIVEQPEGLASLDGSISHHGNMVVAFAVALFHDKDE